VVGGLLLAFPAIFVAGVTLIGLAASMALGLWWLQYVAAAALLIWLIPETREAIG